MDHRPPVIKDFFSLTPDHVLAATETMGVRTTGLCYPLGSLENRVYELEREDNTRVVAKFYRPGRWSEAAILDEHRLLAALVDMEVPVCAPTPFPNGRTLAQTPEGIYFTIFPRTGGRSPDELTVTEYGQLGRLLGRIHNVSASLSLHHRPVLSPQTYGLDCLAAIKASGHLSLTAEGAITRAVTQLVEKCQAGFHQAKQLVVHADCHRGNLLRGRDGFFFLDFDDMATGPAVQDMWLLLPARPADCPNELEAMLSGYGQFRDFDRRELRLIEGLRGLRYVRYAAWIARRFDDPSFSRVFTDFGTEVYWQRLQNDLYEQLALLDAPLY
jgi:Ser/Thr protein kinase RdoA (MazF antagonist)